MRKREGKGGRYEEAIKGEERKKEIRTEGLKRKRGEIKVKTEVV